MGASHLERLECEDVVNLTRRSYRSRKVLAPASRLVCVCARARARALGAVLSRVLWRISLSERKETIGEAFGKMTHLISIR